jgi:nucleoside-diphosphate-sugar epimerase
MPAARIGSHAISHSFGKGCAAMRFERVLVTGAGGLLGRHVVAALGGECEVVGLDVVPGAGGIEMHVGDVTDRELVGRAVAGCDAVVHVAAIPNIVSGSGSDIVRVNVTGTWNVFDAAEQAGTRRVVLCSSDSVVGFTVLAGTMIPPEYLPIDEAHPLRPTDPYALSKRLGEEVARSFSDRGLEAVALRPVFIAHPESRAEIEARARDPGGYRPGAAGGAQPAAGGPVWHHVDPRDAARAFRLALELERVRFDAFFVSAATTLSAEPTLERLAAWLGGVLPEVRAPQIWQENPFAPLYDPTRAREVLGFEPRHDARAWGRAAG